MNSTSTKPVSEMTSLFSTPNLYIILVQLIFLFSSVQNGLSFSGNNYGLSPTIVERVMRDAEKLLGRTPAKSAIPANKS